MLKQNLLCDAYLVLLAHSANSDGLLAVRSCDQVHQYMRIYVQFLFSDFLSANTGNVLLQRVTVYFLVEHPQQSCCLLGTYEYNLRRFQAASSHLMRVLRKTNVSNLEFLC
jgi:hypothetical protein